ncbi:MAG: FKBP-type peptidyl-prolyl cis-trans isomerase [Lachnospira sp.]|nr:FKBP-type peptidyl-prolyl cis-trans isomerase [Lachnospira sp.]
MKKNIFKRVLAGLSIVAVMGCLTGCNNKIKVEYQYDAAQYVTLGEYKGLEVNIDRTEVENELIEKKIKEDIESYTEYTEVKREAKEEDRVTVTFTGSIGGMTIEGFSGEDSTYVLGKDTFLIDGFIDALYGMKSGDKKVVTLTVPETFTENTDYAGKRIVYDLSVTKVEQVNVPMMTDGFVKETFGINTVAEYKETLRKNLSSKVDEEVAAIKKEKVLLKLQENATINGYPEEFLAKKKEEFESSIKVYALMLNLSNDEYCQKNFGFSFDEYVKKAVAQDAIIQLVAKQEQLYVTEYEYKDKLEPFALAQGYTSKEAFVEKYGKNEIVKNMLFEKAQNFVIDSAVVK